MLSLKTGVFVGGIKPEMLLAIAVADQVYTQFNVAFVITSVLDGVHTARSLHYVGEAVDIRIVNIPTTAIRSSIVALIKSRLGIHFDVILESDHLHIEFDPKGTAIPVTTPRPTTGQAEGRYEVARKRKTKRKVVSRKS